MTKFLIQTIDGTIQHDFAFHLIKSLDYHNWFYGRDIYEFATYPETPLDEPNCIPIGSLEFVMEYAQLHFNLSKKDFRPINIPSDLMAPVFLKREMREMSKEKIALTSPAFLKSATEYKKFTDIVSDNASLSNVPDDTYLVSDVIDIESEWRLFVHHGELVGAQNYSGDFKLSPNYELVELMIEKYRNSPLSYTLDVGINKDGTFLIEVHPFVSCGLYGFADYKILPDMMREGYRYFIESTNGHS